MLAIITVVFTWYQSARQQEIENQRAEREQQIAVQRAQDEALQAYLDQMSTLLLEENLRASKPDSEVRTLARARTLAILGSLEGDPGPSLKEADSVNFQELLDPSSALPARKKTVVQFLYEASLINTDSPVILLDGADLESTDLSGLDLNNADLGDALLNAAELLFSDLENADLSNTVMHRAELNAADLGGANLEDADLFASDLTAANLGDANLSGADLHDADLGGVKQIGADLKGADLSDADLSGANLRNVTGITPDELEQQTKSLRGATMPNGQKYEDWLKSNEGRRENGENNSPS